MNGPHDVKRAQFVQAAQCAVSLGSARDGPFLIVARDGQPSLDAQKQELVYQFHHAHATVVGDAQLLGRVGLHQGGDDFELLDSLRELDSVEGRKGMGSVGKIFTKDGLISTNPGYPVWRAGANAATKLHTEADITLGGLKVPTGDYTLFVDISDPDNWVLIVNKQTGQWGLQYDKTQDLGRVKMTMSIPLTTVENLKYTLTDLGGTTGKLTLEWENHSASVLIAVH